jgi:hypothetical protein
MLFTPDKVALKMANGFLARLSGRMKTLGCQQV